MQMLGLMVTPFSAMVYLVVFYFVIKRGVSVKLLRKLQRRNSIQHVCWLIIICSISILAGTPFALLFSTRLGGEKRVARDASIDWLSAEHIPYVVLAILTLLLVLLVPIVLLWRPTHIWPQLTGLLDEATHIYDPRYRWWACFNFLRRLLYGVLTVAVQSGSVHALVTTIYTLLLLAVHVYFKYDNVNGLD